MKKNVVLGVCATIAAYKSVDLCRRLVEEGANVAPILTEDATKFVGEVTFSAVATERAHTSMWSDDDPIPHTRLGQWADVVVVAPASADFIAKLAHGFSGDLLSATLLATRAPVVVCPSMHTEMWENMAVQENISLLRSRGVHIVDPEVGELAGGDVGAGRFPETQTIVNVIESIFTEQDLLDTTVLVTAGGTREAIDNVRFIGNRSSGKQGHAIAAEAASRGAKTILITTSALPVANDVEKITVQTAEEMAHAVAERSDTADIVIMAAAVADYRPTTISPTKIKKSDSPMTISLAPTTDILADLAKRRQPQQLIVGFAAEDQNVIENAKSKLKNKDLDLVVANDVSQQDAGFDGDSNDVTIISKHGDQQQASGTKRQVAGAVLDTAVSLRKR